MAERRPGFRDHAATIRELGGYEGLYARLKVVLVYGSSEYLVHHTVRQIQSRSAAAVGSPTITLEAGALDAAAVQTLCGQTSLFEPAALYLVRRCEQAKTLAQSLRLIKSTTALANHLCLVYRGESPPAPLRAELVRLGGRMIPCFDPWPNELPQAAAVLAEEHGFKLRPDAAALLADAAGDLGKLAGELAKLALLHPGRTEPLAAAEIAPQIGMLRQDDAFRLDRLLLERQWPHAQALVDDLLQRGEKPTALLGIVAGHCRTVIRVKDALARGTAREALASALKMPPFVAKMYAQAVGRLGAESSYLQALRLCHEGDLYLKSSGLRESLVIARIVDALAAPG